MEDTTGLVAGKSALVTGHLRDGGQAFLR